MLEPDPALPEIDPEQADLILVPGPGVHAQRLPAGLRRWVLRSPARDAPPCGHARRLLPGAGPRRHPSRPSRHPRGQPGDGNARRDRLPRCVVRHRARTRLNKSSEPPIAGATHVRASRGARVRRSPGFPSAVHAGRGDRALPPPSMAVRDGEVDAVACDQAVPRKCPLQPDRGRPNREPPRPPGPRPRRGHAEPVRARRGRGGPKLESEPSQRASYSQG